MTTDDPKFKAGEVFSRLSRTVNRAGWDKGPWDAEPDKELWFHEGYPCAAVRNDVAGAWCGYVGIPEGHPLFGKNHNDVELDAHGGLTWSSSGKGTGLDAGHQANTLNGSAELAFWWFGFDCNHAWDQAPGMDARMSMYGMYKDPADRPQLPGTQYRTLAFVKDEVNKLAKQIHALEEPKS